MVVEGGVNILVVEYGYSDDSGPSPEKQLNSDDIGRTYTVEMRNIAGTEKRLAARRLKRKDEKRRRRERDALITRDPTLYQERSKFAQQFCRAYGANKSSPDPFSLHLTNFSMESALGVCCRQKCSGFENYKIGFHSLSPTMAFPTSKLVYLSPDAQSPLLDLETDTIYVIGGLVDENVRRGASLAAANDIAIESARLPLEKFGPQGWGAANKTKSSALPINIVLSILLSYRQHKDWRKAFETNLPRRFQR
ncbi:unnamed protein product [Schistocephalus solidus]|uniref:SAM-dependent MTase TRM10-type domain-containing protein n=1 Tax=Schistocephalus solidus TaxID=70667 RepID=A0A183TE36_SCHSO|nr:unnamed protein product [Schistocephalus solidus]